jgi:hypothetical protein
MNQTFLYPLPVLFLSHNASFLRIGISSYRPLDKHLFPGESIPIPINTILAVKEYQSLLQIL